MWIMLLLFSIISLAQDMSSEKYCFTSSQDSALASKKFSTIQVPTDIAAQDENCLTIQMKAHRRELVQRFILSSLPGAYVAFSSEDVRREPCRLKVEKEKQKSTERLNVGYTDQTPQLNKTESNSNGTEVMQIETLKEFQLAVDEDEIKGACRYITPNRYEISIEVKKNPKPIVPVGLPPGTTVVMNPPPPDQETAKLSTQLQLSRGERIELGGVVKNIRDKNRSVDVRPALQIETSRQTGTEKVFLSLQ